MTEHAPSTLPLGGIDDDAPPTGTAIVRPLRHVKAVRERHTQQLAERSLGPESRSARAWSWALGETNVAPVADGVTVVPPSRSDIEAETAVADERRLRGDQENRADGAATILRWLVSEDDRVPVRGPNCGELVDGFGDVVRSLDRIAEVLEMLSAHTGQAQPDDADYLNGVIATLRWATQKDAEAPISGVVTTRVTTGNLKAERVRAEDVIEQLVSHGAGELPSRHYGLGVQSAIKWLLGDSTTLN